MKVVGVVKQKGGAGATTLAVHLAQAAHQAGVRVLVLDTDPQGSASAWAAAREGQPPAVARISSAKQLPAVLKAARDAGMQLVLIDTAPRHDADAAAIARAADFCILPAKTGVFDLTATTATITLVQATKTPAFVVLNDVPREGTESQDARAALAPFGLEIWEGEIHSLKAMRSTLTSGRTVFDPVDRRDWRGLQTATAEVGALWAEVRQRVGV